MKKRRLFQRVFSLLLCILTFACVGCSMESSLYEDDGSEEYEEIAKTKTLDGTKVLSKPSDYSLSEALGDYSTNFFNLFAREVLYDLYVIYENPSIYGSAMAETMLSTSYKAADGEELSSLVETAKDTGGSTVTAYTYSNSSSSGKIYYLYDSIRYTISSVEYEYTEDGGTKTYTGNQIVTLDYDTAWNWTIPEDTYSSSANYGTLFHQLDLAGSAVSIDTTDSEKITINGSTFETLYSVGSSYLPSFSEFYAGSDVKYKNDAETIKDYYYSPYYNTTGATYYNYFQDALEYATYLIVLGYDYTSADDADYFDFTITYSYDTTNTSQVTGISGMTVGGWDTSKISITEALEKAKDLYTAMGSYVGLTDKNREQIASFIKDKVIGSAAYSKNAFSVDVVVKEEDPSGGEDVYTTYTYYFNRNYDAIIERVIDYACDQVPIGVNTENGSSTTITLQDTYLTSTITDYDGNYFFLNYEWNGEDDDAHWLNYIQPAEYQSLVIFPQKTDIAKGYALSEVALVLEYYDDPEDDFTDTSGKTYASSITINIGARFYDHSEGSEGTVYEFGSKQVTISYGKYYELSSNPDDYMFWFSDESSLADVCLDKNTKEIFYGTTDGEFNNDIGGGVINAFANGKEIVGSYGKSITLTGSSKAKDYYKTNNSSTYGVYGTLNEAMFAGEDGCDYFEIYFDIVKTKGASNINYNFKVGLFYVGYAEEA